MIENDSLSLSQIRDDFDNGVDTKETGLISYWNFETENNNIVPDMKNGNDITLFSGASLAE